MSSPVIVGPAAQTGNARPAERAVQLAAAPLFALGLAISAVAVLDLGMAWWPFRFGSGEWEFGTVTRTFDSLALLTTGLGFLVIAATVRSLRWALGVLGIVLVVLLVGLLGCAALYALNVPVALGAVPAEAGPMLRRAIVRTSVFGVIYLVLYAWLSWFTWRGFRAA